MDMMKWFSRPAERTPLGEGEVIFYVRGEAMRRMLSALLGASGEAREGVAVRLRIADAQDGALLASCLRDARADGAPLIAFTETPAEWRAPPGIASRCLSRPFMLSELAEAAAVLSARTPEEAALSDDGSLHFDAESGEVRFGGAAVRLTPREAQLFGLLLAAMPAPVPREALTAHFSRRGANGADVYIGYLRRRLAGLPLAILTVRGEGYALVMCRSEAEEETKKETSTKAEGQA